MGQIKAPYLTYEEINRAAVDLLRTYDHLDKAPVDVEALIEFDVGLDVIPHRGLKEEFGVDGFLSLDMTAITVDEYVLERHPTRYRFTLAHELGHRVLHSEVFEALNIDTIQQWTAFYLGLPEQDHGWFERHAYWFAGAILVPEERLMVEYEAALAKVRASGLDGAQLSYHSRSTVAGAIARRFWVSTVVVHKRLNEVGLW